MKSFTEFLTEKLIVIGKGKKYGQVVILSGGAASGKGFAVSNFFEGDKFKVRDVDEYKRNIIELAKVKDTFPELKNMDLKNPKDVFFLHNFLVKKQIISKSLNLLLQDLKQDRLPNLLFDMTGNDISKIENITNRLITLGYDKKNINLAWILTDYKISVTQNQQRDRIVPDDILLKTHEGAAFTMFNIIKHRVMPQNVDGEFIIILNNKENTIYFTDKDGKNILNSKDQPTIKSFKYIKVKQTGKQIQKDVLSGELYDWIKKSIPKTNVTKDMFP